MKRKFDIKLHIFLIDGKIFCYFLDGENEMLITNPENRICVLPDRRILHSIGKYVITRNVIFETLERLNETSSIAKVIYYNHKSEIKKFLERL